MNLRNLPNLRIVGNLVSRYIVGAALPYVLLVLFLLTAVLFAQQAGRFAEFALEGQPFSLLLQVGSALLPSVLMLTLPAAVLAGIIIGFARMGTDSEIVAMRAAGVGTWSLIWPVLLIGLVVTGITTYVHMKEAPQAARELRRAALQGALRKLDSPVEPRNFTTEIPGFVIYVRDGDKVRGSWGRVFIYRQERDGSSRVVTARSGRIDSSADKAELVLSDALTAKFPDNESTEQDSYVMERSAQLRLAIDTGRQAIVGRLQKPENSSEELGWDDLRTHATSGPILERRDAQRTLHRRLALSIAPLVFALLGGVFGIRIRRGGRGLGVLLALGIMVTYYLLSLLGESLTKLGAVSPLVGSWMATGLLLIAILALLTVKRVPLIGWVREKFRRLPFPVGKVDDRAQVTARVGVGESGFPSLLDTSLFRTLTSSFLLSFISLVSIFVIFTLFELWRFVATSRSGVALVAKYLLFLLPLVAVEVFPATMLIAVLITYALLARRSEAVAWWASGQSVYRLMLPGLLFALAAGLGIWLVQEHLMPSANVKQDSLRAQIRGGGARAITGSGRQWLASTESNRLYSYEFNERDGSLSEPVIYELDPEAVHLASVTTGKQAKWSGNNRIALQDAETIKLRGIEMERQSSSQIEIAGVEPQQVFRPTIDRPSQLSASALSSYLRAAKRRGIDVSTLILALQRKYAGPFGVVVMAFIGMPLALAFGRRGAIVALVVAVVVSIAYWGLGGGFQQLGNYGLLPPAVAAWSPPVIFAAAGTYFLSRIRT